MAVPDILSLDLSRTRAVVLSACETGLGRNGLEYSTLARAFMLAGSPAVVATLWQVPDVESSILVSKFYKHLSAGQSRLRALVHAQRDVLAEVPQARERPALWAGYVLFGKP